jgi:glyoxylase-like metal-dependent hydrolase (beta-lactamase superfamily II)
VKFADFDLTIISDGSLRLDGGAMFGVVPRVIWEKYASPDNYNRILVGLNCLLIRTPHENILVDTGVGELWTPSELQRYAIIHPPTIVSSLANHGLAPDDISIVINTHLHFDHAGGNTQLVNGHLQPTFPNARYVVQRAEYQHACHPHERDRASYNPAHWEVLRQTNQLELIDGAQEIVPGVRVWPVVGHNQDTQLVRVDTQGHTAVFFADIIPTTWHLPFAWTMGYDLYPVDLVAQKKQLIPQAATEGWLAIFEHDPYRPWGRITATAKPHQYEVVDY